MKTALMVFASDLIDEGFEGFNKFIPYYLHPETTYSVALTRTPHRTKISVGSNPWSPRPRTHNIASICERYGGGGHAVVGAGAMIGRRASLRGVVVVGDDCRISEDATVKQSVLLPGSSVGSGAYLEECIVGPGYEIRPEECIRGGALVRRAA